MTGTHNIQIEVCAGSVEDVIIAEAEGADRVELNSALPLGGLTPSSATVELAKAQSKLPIVAMARPRPGNFVYNDLEFQTLQREIDDLIQNGADGIAVGITDEAGNPDRTRLEKIVSSLKGRQCQLVYHRAIDIAPEWRTAFQQLIDLGFQRVLTSGQKSSALAGADTIAEMVVEFGARIEILPGSSINPENAAEIVERTGCNQIHGSFSSSANRCQSEAADFGHSTRTNPNVLREVVTRLKSLPKSSDFKAISD